MQSLHACTIDAHVVSVGNVMQVIGTVSVQGLISTAEGGRVGLVEDVVVSPFHRGRGGPPPSLCSWTQEVMVAGSIHNGLDLQHRCGHNASEGGMRVGG